jgi:hypothetical protein
MGIRKSIVLQNGDTAEFHIIQEFSFDIATGDCIVKVASYVSEADIVASRPSSVSEFSCDFITHGETITNQIYANLLLQYPFIGGETFGLVDVSGQSPRIKPARPSLRHSWDSETGAWVIFTQQVEACRSEARERINSAWKSAEADGFAAYGRVFDSDPRATQRILGASQAALIAKSAGQTININWTCKDNSTLAMDTDMLVQIPIFIATAGATLHAKCQALKAMIDSATTIEEIEAITWATL